MDQLSHNDQPDPRRPDQTPLTPFEIAQRTIKQLAPWQEVQTLNYQGLHTIGYYPPLPLFESHKAAQSTRLTSVLHLAQDADADLVLVSGWLSEQSEPLYDGDLKILLFGGSYSDRQQRDLSWAMDEELVDYFTQNVDDLEQVWIRTMLRNIEHGGDLLLIPIKRYANALQEIEIIDPPADEVPATSLPEWRETVLTPAKQVTGPCSSPVILQPEVDPQAHYLIPGERYLDGTPRISKDDAYTTLSQVMGERALSKVEWKQIFDWSAQYRSPGLVVIWNPDEPPQRDLKIGIISLGASVSAQQPDLIMRSDRFEYKNNPLYFIPAEAHGMKSWIEILQGRDRAGSNSQTWYVDIANSAESPADQTFGIFSGLLRECLPTINRIEAAVGIDTELTSQELEISNIVDHYHKLQERVANNGGDEDHELQSDFAQLRRMVAAIDWLCENNGMDRIYPAEWNTPLHRDLLAVSTLVTTSYSSAANSLIEREEAVDFLRRMTLYRPSSEKLSLSSIEKGELQRYLAARFPEQQINIQRCPNLQEVSVELMRFLSLEKILARTRGSGPDGPRDHMGIVV